MHSPVSSRCLRGRSCLGRGRTTRPGFALPRASGSISTLLFRGASEQEQSTRRRRERRSREDGAGYAAVPPQTTRGQRQADGCSPQTEKQGGRRWVRGRAPSNNGRTTSGRRLFSTNRTRVRSRSSLLLIQCTNRTGENGQNIIWLVEMLARMHIVLVRVEKIHSGLQYSVMNP